LRTRKSLNKDKRKRCAPAFFLREKGKEKKKKKGPVQLPFPVRTHIDQVFDRKEGKRRETAGLAHRLEKRKEGAVRELKKRTPRQKKVQEKKALAFREEVTRFLRSMKGRSCPSHPLVRAKERKKKKRGVADHFHQREEGKGRETKNHLANPSAAGSKTIRRKWRKGKL